MENGLKTGAKCPPSHNNPDKKQLKKQSRARVQLFLSPMGCDVEQLELHTAPFALRLRSLARTSGSQRAAGAPGEQVDRNLRHFRNPQAAAHGTYIGCNRTHMIQTGGQSFTQIL